MTTKRLKLHLEQLLWEYVNSQIHKTKPDSVDLNYTVNDGTGKSYGEMVVRTPKKDTRVTLKVRK